MRETRALFVLINENVDIIHEISDLTGETFMNRLICLITLALLASTAAFADIARPDKTPKPSKDQKSIATTMTIRLDKDAKEAKLIIPKSQIKQLRAALDDADQDSDATASYAGSFSRTQTIVSGLFLSLAFIFGGVWFVRSGKAATKAGKSLVIIAIIAGIGSVATFVYANAGPPAEARSITGKMFSQAVHIYNVGSGAIKLETKADGDGRGIELIVPNPPDKPDKSDGE